MRTEEANQDKFVMAGLLGFANMSLQSRTYFRSPSLPLLLFIFPQFPFQQSYQLQQDQHLVMENKTKQKLSFAEFNLFWLFK